jgi:hypothetical protein
MMSTSTTAETSSNVILPIRQPRGPEPGKDFSSRRSTRTVVDELVDTLSKQRLTHVGA